MLQRRIEDSIEDTLYTHENDCTSCMCHTHICVTSKCKVSVVFVQLAEAANDAAFQVALAAVSEFTSFDEQETLVKQLIKQHVLYRSLQFVVYTCSYVCCALCTLRYCMWLVIEMLGMILTIVWF